ncbi:MAG TPA: hydrolase [Bacillota bacterium]|nr:hydrolase [Bacillota bacterium]
MGMASGINILGQNIKSLIFSTDVAIIRNNNADAVMAVYPFTPQPVLTQAIAAVADKPVFMGVGGGTTQGRRVINLALHAEFQGAMAVVLNAPVDDITLKKVDQNIDIPIVITVVNEMVGSRLENGADILNVSAGPTTPKVVAKIRKNYPTVPIIATGGPTPETIQQTILAGANAVTYTPPSIAEIFSSLMETYR